ncbi:30S ribosomal protein S8 [Candidatus Dojkabacteria bacterium HGW-Dojkabacteria-1]|uniref:Small ribosomal subunit protein uS8 n=1 Tax=Candidatus Dojkabacteria bacterium HGW-Dojkabacteria-1 TaxID=2013761 RepID=A0A2N2F328_9BACT|nr:ribosomal protein S8 [uncultured bacterium]PKN02563.1 MAG: 30S ribosomal protein S8 [Candidatus Dojkabacteria bacterium HGW-Dojkabacteria-1]
MNDLVADFLARMKNGIQRKRESITVPSTKMNTHILTVLKQEEMIEDFDKSDEGIEVIVKYDDGEPVVTQFERVSSPGQRIYVTSKEITPVMNGRGISIISTSKGLMTGAQAKSKNLGGELICKVW